METNIIIFQNDQFGEIRMVEVNGEHVFVAKDVAKALGYSENTNVATATSFIPNEWKGVYPINTPYGTQEYTVIAEQGLYFWLGRCDKPNAIPYQKWVASEVIPNIRKHGAYMTPQAIEDALLNPDTLIQLATTLKDERQKRQLAEAKANLLDSVTIEQKKQLEAQAPKVLFADAVATSNRSVLVAELAKILRQNGLDIGQNRLFAWLREQGYLCSKGEYYNQPRQWAMDLGLFELKKTSITKPDGCVFVTVTPKITGKGQIYFANKLIKAVSTV